MFQQVWTLSHTADSQFVSFPWLHYINYRVAFSPSPFIDFKAPFFISFQNNCTLSACTCSIPLCVTQSLLYVFKEAGNDSLCQLFVWINKYCQCHWTYIQYCIVYYSVFSFVYCVFMTVTVQVVSSHFNLFLFQEFPFILLCRFAEGTAHLMPAAPTWSTQIWSRIRTGGRGSRQVPLSLLEIWGTLIGETRVPLSQK